ncbi:MAG: Na+:solute symporter, partial [Bacteroidetes bacterium]
AMIGALGAAVVALSLPEVGGLDGLLSHPVVSTKLSILPDFANLSWQQLLPLFIIPIAVQWWSVWYPGAEPGGGGYIAQRMLSAKDEKNAIGATLLFNAAHYALRPWPWIIVALASIIVFPELSDIQAKFPNVEAGILKDDLAYPAMLTFLPAGLLGIVMASLIAAFMSTISTHLNWGSSYVVNDFYRRFVKPEASDRELVMVGRLSTVLLMAMAALLAPWLENAKRGFDLMLQIGAGTGLLFILRWFWWRINAWSEITAMVVSFLVALYFQVLHPALGLPEIATEWQLIIGVSITTLAWVVVTFMSPGTDPQVLRSFFRQIRPAGGGWQKVVDDAAAEGQDLGQGEGSLSQGILAMVVGAFTVYGALFAVGFWIYGRTTQALILTVLAVIGTWGLFRLWGQMPTRPAD